MTDPLAALRATFRVEGLLVYRSAHWSWSVRPVQATLAAGVLSLNRPCTSFADITEGEGADLAQVVSVIEPTVAAFSSPAKMNYLMLMMVDPQLHFHVIPRYPDPVEFGDIEWSDSGWPGPPVLSDHADRKNSEIVLTIRQELRAMLGGVGRAS